jgi:NAD-dependent deacetylase
MTTDFAYEIDDEILSARRMVEEAENIVIFSGSGLSKASGVPTYRDMDDPIWQTHDPKIYGSRHGLVNHTEQVLEQYDRWRKDLAQLQPNQAHKAIAMSDKVTTHITQNVDDLSERAGKPAIHLHGEIMKDKLDPELGVMRPDVVLFGECLPLTEMAVAHDKMKEADLLIAIGTSLEVQPAASLWTDIAGDNSIFINPNQSYPVGVSINIPVEHILSKLLWNA